MIAKKYLKLLSINLIILVLLFIVIDPFFVEKIELHDTRHVLLREPYPNQDISITPDNLYMTFTENLIQKAYDYKTDKDGFIIGDSKIVSKKQNSDSAIIIFYGGSTTECLYVDEEKRFPFLVGEKLLSEPYGKKIQTLNAGSSGNNSLHSTINFLANGIPRQPNIVVLMHNINDLNALVNTGTYWYTPPRYSIIQEQKAVDKSTLGYRTKAFFRSVKDLLVPNLYSKTKKVLKGMGNKKPQEFEDEWKDYRMKTSTTYEEKEKLFRSSILGFIRLAKSHGIEVVLMTQFNRLQPNDTFIRSMYEANKNAVIGFDMFCEYYKKFNNAIRDIAANENLLLIDLDKKIPSNRNYIYDSVHLNTKGSEMAADTIAKELKVKFSNLLTNQ